MARHVFSQVAILELAQPQSRGATEGSSRGLNREEIGGGEKQRGRDRREIQ